MQEILYKDDLNGEVCIFFLLLISKSKALQALVYHLYYLICYKIIIMIDNDLIENCLKKKNNNNYLVVTKHNHHFHHLNLTFLL